MLIAYVAYIFFQLKTHRELFDSQEVIKNKKRVYIGEQCFRLQMTQLIWWHREREREREGIRVIE